jgi:hypothetical protein
MTKQEVIELIDKYQTMLDESYSKWVHLEWSYWLERLKELNHE